MEEYRKQRSKILIYKCCVCKKIYENEVELRQHVVLTQHYYKIDSIEEEIKNII